MKLFKKFIIHFLIVSGVYILLLALTVPVTVGLILPGLELEESFILIVIFLVTLIFLIYFGWYFGSPLLLMMKWINQIMDENFSEFHHENQLYTYRGKWKLRYHLYKDIFIYLDRLRLQLKKAEIEREEDILAKRDWISGISHDLKTPLTYIKGYTNLLVKPNFEWTEEEKSHFFKEIIDKSTHMEQLIQDLNLSIQFDHNEGLSMQNSMQDIGNIVQQVLADVSNDSRCQLHHFELLNYGKETQILCDPHLIKRALLNLYMNSALHNQSPVNILTTIFQEEENFVIKIQDDGIGMDEKTKQNIFHRYYRGTTTQHSSEGTGLGMAIVKQLIEAHNGDIQVESLLNHGTTFTIRLPYVHDTPTLKNS